MSGLVAYDSSDDDASETGSSAPQILPPVSKTELHTQGEANTKANTQDIQTSKKTHQEPPSQPAPTIPLPISSQDNEPIGPSLPSLDNPEPTVQDAQDAPSPYSSNRSLLHDLTLPAVPDFDIPPSPPGSPPPATNKKFEQFLTLKKKGTHFNAKLENSAAMRNPALASKLLAFVGMPDGDPAQYETTLSPELWNPGGFPEEAFRGKLRRARDKLAKEREAERASGNRSTVEFVPAIEAGGTASSSRK
ncbi:hypothetical protein VHEMI03985 [[Torrubiella] hemipterigena]|uniref:HCNGP-like protein n=1 Tax=[Torrubiella] hemipterigena TaxID=1531966 RepID=A0A0A1TF21_9HYPO|nr:hypothetical protein VHEMI03985 [[Torrubiella] hemipterigena]